MDDWYETSDFYYDQLFDELLCEYVDGTMDPCVRSAFEDLIRADPEIGRHVERLAETQNILKTSGKRISAPSHFQSRLRARLNAETGKIDLFGIAPDDTAGRTSRFLLLALVLLWTGLVLPLHDSDPAEKTRPVNAATHMQVSSPAGLMTPAFWLNNTQLQHLSQPAERVFTDHASFSPTLAIRTNESEYGLTGD